MRITIHLLDKDKITLSGNFTINNVNFEKTNSSKFVSFMNECFSNDFKTIHVTYNKQQYIIPKNAIAYILCDEHVYGGFV